MDRPGAGPARAERPRNLSTSPRPEALSGDSTESVSPEDAPRECATCSRPLSVGERMFYFLEGAGAAPSCHACLARLRGEGAREANGTATAASSKALGDAVRSFVQEELDRIDVALDRLPGTHPDLPLARSLQDTARQQLSQGRLTDAVVSLSDVRRILPALERGRKRAPLSAPWDESVEELFDRVVARARAMSRPVPPSPEDEEGVTTLPARGQRSVTGMSS